MEFVLKLKNKINLSFINDLFNKEKISKKSLNGQYLDGSLSKHMQKDLGLETPHNSDNDYTKFL